MFLTKHPQLILKKHIISLLSNITQTKLEERLKRSSKKFQWLTVFLVMIPKKEVTMTPGNIRTHMDKLPTIDRVSNSKAHNINLNKIKTSIALDSNMEQIMSTTGGGKRNTKGGITAKKRKNSIRELKMLSMNFSGSKDLTGIHQDLVQKSGIATTIKLIKNSSKMKRGCAGKKKLIGKI